MLIHHEILDRPRTSDPTARTAWLRNAAPGIGTDAFADLTRREREILTYLVARYSDREIADALFISYRTVTTHVANILGKLGVGSRREAAALVLGAAGRN